MRPLPISFNALSTVKNCPKMYAEVKVFKRIKEVESEENKEGNRLHKALEIYLKTRGSMVLPQEFEGYKPYADAILAVKGDMHVECKFAIDTKFQPVDFFRGRNIFARAVADVMHIQGDWALIMDHKTGKYKPGSNQLALCSAIVFCSYPQIQRIRAGYFWLKHGTPEKFNYTRDQLPAIWATFHDEIADFRKVFAEELWTPRPSGLCYGWCPVTDCEYWKPKGSRR